MSFLKKGKEVEVAFASLYASILGLDVKPIYSTKEEDIKEHWDVRFGDEGDKYDVKGVKKIFRDDSYTNELYHFIEIKNVNGDNGWAYGDADKFAFETNKYFIIVSKLNLQKFITDNIKKIFVDSSDKCLYCLYTRKDRKDIITMVTSIDLAKISDIMIVKPNLEYFKIGESVVPDIRKRETIRKLLG